MMNIFLIGNGFDLSHGLPTKYENFLHVVDFLVQNYDSNMVTVGSVLGDDRLQEKDALIKKCYERYAAAYNDTLLSKDRINKLVEMAKKNVWFSYLLESFDEDLGWIDFEKEVAGVIDAFSDFLNNTDMGTRLTLDADTYDERFDYIIGKFNFFYEEDKTNSSYIAAHRKRRIKPAYFLEYPKGSGIHMMHRQKIIETLWKALSELSCMLKEYLFIFVEETIDTLISKELIPSDSLYNGASKVITFNYTTVFEKLYNSTQVLHIHGIVNENIVLGINPNEDDNIETVEVSFLPFKKYYQRVRYGTDEQYLDFCADAAEATKRYNDLRLFVVGHSLDITDKDIITEVFDMPRNIIILYHDEERIGGYIQKLVAIYGKEGFDRLRREKRLRFLPQKNLFPTNTDTK